MSKVYHQCGHNSNWNIDSLNSNIGDGLIISPVNQKFSSVENLHASIKARSLFDPQFYLPSSQKKNFVDYPFFPETISGANGFSTADFAQIAEDAARQCLDFQVRNNFEKIIIPARFYNQMITEWIPQQEVFLRPFLSQLSQLNVKVPVFQTLPITQHMLLDLGFRERILNWVTSFPRIDGIYLLVNVVEDSKQICDSEILFNLMTFLNACKKANLQLLVGYTNAESLLLQLVGNVDCTIGSFENTRRFSDERFLNSEEEMRGPKARIYLPGLMTWIQFNHAREIRDANPGLWDKIHEFTQFSEDAFNQSKEPTFNQPLLYKHYFSIFSGQFKDLASYEPEERYHNLRRQLVSAQEYYAAIENIPVDLDRHAKGQHIGGWLDCINKYYREFMK